MQPNVPVPTDNLYKFAATFGLVLIIASFVGLYLANTAYYAELVSISEKSFELNREEKVPPKARQAMEADLTKREELNSENLKIYNSCLLFLLVVGSSIAWGGFALWGRFQALHDELLEIQVTKARKEAHGSSEYREFSPKPTPPKKKPTWPWKPKPETKNPA